MRLYILAFACQALQIQAGSSHPSEASKYSSFIQSKDDVHQKLIPHRRVQRIEAIDNEGEGLFASPSFFASLCFSSPPPETDDTSNDDESPGGRTECVGVPDAASIDISTGLSYFRDLFWDEFAKLDMYKTKSQMWDCSGDRPTLDRMHYLVLYVWWDGEDQVAHDRSDAVDSMTTSTQQYTGMSFGKHSLSFEVLDTTHVLSQVTPTNADFGNSEDATRQIVNDLGYVEFVDYDGILIIYNTADSGPFSGAGGWAGVNGNFQWNSMPTWYDVMRHETGHNYGHPHHRTNLYDYRLNRDGTEFDYDGWDMMSGGNGFERSDLAAASKWYFNWITDDAVVLMSPEGPSDHCPDCVSSVSSLVLKPFDDWDLQPSSSNLMAVHIPVMADSSGKTYSYWLSYRGTGNDGGAAGGLSMHVSWFNRGTGPFGASYDSLNFDAFGDTNTRDDSFVVPNTCYVVAPPLILRDIDSSSAEEVQPIVCVDSVDEGVSITISVSFLDSSSPPDTDDSVLESETVLSSCPTDGGSSGERTADVSNSRAHMIHVTEVGHIGMVNINLCLESAESTLSVTAYFYDTYPYAPLALDSPFGYGAYQSLEVVALAACADSMTGDNTLEYQGEYGETFIIVVPSEDTATTATLKWSTTCNLQSCLAGFYLDGTTCSQCPAESPVSEAGSTSVADCGACPGGFEQLSPSSAVCVVSNTFDTSSTQATYWRLWALSSWTDEGWKWDVLNLEFFSSTDCSGSALDTSTVSAFDSGNAGGGWGPENAFDSSSTSAWGGRSDSDDVFYIGWQFASTVEVQCVIVSQVSGALTLHVQGSDDGDEWTNVWKATNVSIETTNTLSISDHSGGRRALLSDE